MPSPDFPPASLLRRLAAGFYDLLLLAGILMVIGVAVVIARSGAAIPPGTLWFQALVLGVATFFYAGFWTRGGQTLGMKSWRLRVETLDGETPDVTRSLLRFAAGLLALLPAGLGLLWMLVDRDQRAWHDRLTGTRVVLLP